jgi:hypothetical protein
VARLLPRVAAQAPARTHAEHERVARWVLENLVNVGSAGRGFRAVYGMFGADGAYVRRDHDFKLIEEVPGPGGSVCLRTTDEGSTSWSAPSTPTSPARRSPPRSSWRC